MDLYSRILLLPKEKTPLNHKKLAITTSAYHCSLFLQETKMPLGKYLLKRESLKGEIV